MFRKFKAFLAEPRLSLEILSQVAGVQPKVSKQTRLLIIIPWLQRPKNQDNSTV